MSRFPFPKATPELLLNALPEGERDIMLAKNKFDDAFHEACTGGKRALKRFGEVVGELRRAKLLREVYDAQECVSEGRSYVHLAALSVNSNAKRLIRILHMSGCGDVVLDENRQPINESPISLVIRTHGNYANIAMLLRCNSRIDERAAQGLMGIIGDKENECQNVTAHGLIMGYNRNEAITILRKRISDTQLER